MESKKTIIPAFFAENGLTATSANHLSNIAKENYMAIERQMAKLEFYKTAVGLIGGSEETVVSCGTGPERFSRIRKWVEEVCACKSLIAYLREAIKAKDKLTRDLDDYGAEEIQDLSEMEPEKEDRLTFEQVLETLPIKERNRYLELETRCAVIGKFIHPDGEYSEARKHFTDRMLSPKEVRENGKDTLVYSYYPNIDGPEIDALFFELQAEHRKAQAELNGMRNEINRLIDGDWRRKSDAWLVEHEKWAESMIRLKERIMREKEDRSKEIEKLRIAIPDSLKPIYGKIKAL